MQGISLDLLVLLDYYYVTVRHCPWGEGHV